MARTAAETATILIDLYDENFGHDVCEPFRITWPQLRSLAAVPRLDKHFLKEVSEVLAETDNCLIPFNDFLFFAQGIDLSRYRMVPDRLLEQCLPDPEDVEVGEVGEDEVCDDEETEETDEDDVEINV